MHFNPAFMANVHSLYGKSGEIWLKDLPAQLNRLSTKWKIQFKKVMPGLSYNFVGIVERLESGEKAVIKISVANEQIAKEVRWLQSFTQAVPKIYCYDEDEHALLMECLEPGYALTQLVKLGNDDSATRIICQLIKDLQLHQQKHSPFKHLSELIIHLDSLHGQLDKHLVSKAKSLFRELTLDKSNDVVLHGDLHHDNILASGAGWKVIDPHGYVGDPTFEVGAMIYNPSSNFPTGKSISKIIERRLNILAEGLPFDAKRIHAWAFCMTMLSLAWSVEDHAILPEMDVCIANVIDKLQF
jgi:streptomycin 6-kinase